MRPRSSLRALVLPAFVGPAVLGTFLCSSATAAQVVIEAIEVKAAPKAEWSFELNVAPAPRNFVVAIGGAASKAPDDDGTGLVRFEAQTAFLMDDLTRVFGTKDAEALRPTVEKLTEAALRKLSDEGKAPTRPWAATAVEAIDKGPELKNAIEETLGQDAAAKLTAFRNARIEAVIAGRCNLATTLLSFELRLRAPQVDTLRPLVETWIEERMPTRSQLTASDLVDETLTVTPISKGFLLAIQTEIIERIRSAKKPRAPGATDPGDDLPLGRGRYPEDDYVLEAAAVAMFRGWEWSEVRTLRSAAWMLGREERRSGVRQARFGDAAHFKSLSDPRANATWSAVVTERCKKAGVDDVADPGPAFTDQPETLVKARVDLVLALFATRVRLRDDQVAPVRKTLMSFVERELSARTTVFGAIDDDAIWRELRFVEGKDPRRGPTSRKALCRSLHELLDVHQRVELGL